MRELLAAFVLLALLALDPARLAGASTDTFATAAADAFGRDVRVVQPPACAASFARAGVTGTFVLWTPDRREMTVCNPERALVGYSPASTFKLLNALIALEIGTVRDEHVTFKWDGVKRWNPEWSRDHDLASGMKHSVVWYYQALARRAGEERMRDWVQRAGYGNGDIGGGVDQFWLSGALRTTALQQVQFLDRLRQNTLPFSTRSQRIVRSLVVLDRGRDWTLYGKTGWAIVDEKDLGWLVGWVERDGKPYVYALNMDLPGAQADAAKREPLLRELLGQAGLLR